MKRVHVVLDCADPAALAAFWSLALGAPVAWTFDPYVAVGAEGDPIMLLLQRVPEPKRGKNRMHVDIMSADIEATVSALGAAGATRLDEGVSTQGPARWIRMADPEGNEFCVCAE